VLSSISARRRKAQEASIPGFVSHKYRLTLTIVSTGIRFTTLPDATPPSFHLPGDSSSALSMASPRGLPSPPTTITALFNPMMGHVSGAYAARVSRDLALCSRFDFNVYSYESEWTMGAEYWLRRTPPKLSPNDSPSIPLPPPSGSHSWDDVRGVVKARASTNNVQSTFLNFFETLY
jgi:distribution and morphology protein 10